MSTAAPKARSIADLLLCLVGPAVWTTHFMVMYGANALICAGTGASQGAGLFRTMAAVATIVGLLGLAGFVAWCLSVHRSGLRAPTGDEQTKFAHQVSILLAALSMLGMAWVALPAMLLAPCDSSA
jgi:hypothetical protein